MLMLANKFYIRNLPFVHLQKYIYLLLVSSDKFEQIFYVFF